MDILRHIVILIATCKLALACLPDIAINPPMIPTTSPSQVTCTTINGTNLNRTVSVSSNGGNSACTRYLTSDGEVRNCKLNRLFNLDLCDCWHKTTVDTTTCKTRPEYVIETEMKNLLTSYGTEVTEVNCPSLQVQGLSRTVYYSNAGPEHCNRRHWIILERNNRRVNLREGRWCKRGEIFNLDLCDCWDKSMTDDTTCRTKAGYDVYTLQKMLIDTYNSSGILDATREQG